MTSTRLTQATGSLTTAATRLMEEGLPWYRELGAQERTWVAQVAHAGITAFIDWYQHPNRRTSVAEHVFAAAPRDLARVISLEQTVALVRTTIAVVESAIDELGEGSERAALREAVLTYSREIAFAAAEVYARAAETRGAWDERLEAFIVDAVVRGDLDDSTLGRASALGWSGLGGIVLVAGRPPTREVDKALSAMRRVAQQQGVELVAGVHGTTMLALVSQAPEAEPIAQLLVPCFGVGPVVHSASVDALAHVRVAARATLSGLRAAPAWPNAPRPVATADLLPERALAQDASAVADLLAETVAPLSSDPVLLTTIEAYLEQFPSLEATARALFIHPNTVRYRLRRVAELTGHAPNEPRGALALRLGLLFARLQTTEDAGNRPKPPGETLA